MTSRLFLELFIVLERVWKGKSRQSRRSSPKIEDGHGPHTINRPTLCPSMMFSIVVFPSERSTVDMKRIRSRPAWMATLQLNSLALSRRRSMFRYGLYTTAFRFIREPIVKQERTSALTASIGVVKTVYFITLLHRYDVFDLVQI